MGKATQRKLLERMNEIMRTLETHKSAIDDGLKELLILWKEYNDHRMSSDGLKKINQAIEELWVYERSLNEYKALIKSIRGKQHRLLSTLEYGLLSCFVINKGLVEKTPAWLIPVLNKFKRIKGKLSPKQQSEIITKLKSLGYIEPDGVTNYSVYLKDFFFKLLFNNIAPGQLNKETPILKKQIKKLLLEEFKLKPRDKHIFQEVPLRSISLIEYILLDYYTDGSRKDMKNLLYGEEILLFFQEIYKKLEVRKLKKDDSISYDCDYLYYYFFNRECLNKEAEKQDYTGLLYIQAIRILMIIVEFQQKMNSNLITTMIRYYKYMDEKNNDSSEKHQRLEKFLPSKIRVRLFLGRIKSKLFKIFWS